MFRANLLCYPWDVIDRGLEDVLAFARGELGATGITLVAGCAPSDRLIRRPAGELYRLRSAGGLFFAPDEAKYANTRCKPIRSDKSRSQGSIAECADACRRLSLAYRVAVSTMRLGGVAARYPAAACKNILGEPSPTCLCPSNPDTVELVCGLVEDVSANHSPDAIELRDFDRGRSERALAGLECAADLGDVGDFLMSLCFCESCRQGARGAEIDVEAAARSVETNLQRIVCGERTPDEALSDLIGRDAILGAYVTWQSESLATQLGAVRARYDGCLILHRRGDEIACTADLRSLSCHVDTLCISHSVSPDAKVRSTIDATRGRCDAACSLAVEFPLSGRVLTDPQVLVAEAAEAAKAGIDNVTFADLGLANPPVADAVKKAIRYARRCDCK